MLRPQNTDDFSNSTKNQLHAIFNRCEFEFFVFSIFFIDVSIGAKQNFETDATYPLIEIPEISKIPL
jgi:hypothetical protein